MTRPCLIVLVAWMSFGCACDSSISVAEVVPSEQRQENILFMDDGFDLGLPVFAGKIAGRYTIDCATTAAGAAAEAHDTKEAFVAALASGDHSCHLRPGVAFDRPVALDTIGKYRDRWNQTMRQGSSLNEEFGWSEMGEIATVFAMVAGPDGDAFHGTATASILAYDNPDVRLVIVQLSLSPQSAERPPFACPTQATVDATVALMMDSDVRRAYIERPRADIEQELDDLIRENKIGIWNRSFGRPSRAATEAALFEAGCGRIDLSRYLAVKGELDLAYEARWPARAYLEVLAAGNDGVQIEGPQDQDGCQVDRTTSIVVGSYGAHFEPAPFSNHGGCVDVLAPGEDILVSLPDGWLMPMSGTSYSAPLVARWASKWKERPFAPETARTAILALRDDQSRIPQDQFPGVLILSPQPTEAQRSALRFEEGSVPASVTAGRLTQDPGWRQVLWPLMLL